MPQYMLSVHTVEGDERPQRTDEQMRQSASDIMQVNADLQSSGAWRYAGRLDSPSAAKVVRTIKGKPRSIDGPFIEAKEQIAGFYIIEVADLEAALGWASRTSEALGAPIEMRELIMGPDDAGG